MEGTETMDATARMNRLRWRCACRPLHEIDALLSDFLEKRFSLLSPAQQEAFAALAEMEDDALWRLIVGKTPCRDATEADVLSLLKKMRIQ